MEALAIPAMAPTRPARGPLDGGGATQRLFDGGATLEDAIVTAWDELVGDGRCACPVCGGSMGPLDGCVACGADLS